MSTKPTRARLGVLALINIATLTNDLDRSVRGWRWGWPGRRASPPMPA